MGSFENAATPRLKLNQYGALFGRRIVLADITCELPDTGVDVLMGPVRAGKSTLFRSLAGVNDANPLFRRWGEAILDGKPVSSDNLPLLAHQNAAVLRGSVREAIIADRRKAESRSARAWDEFARETLETFGLPQLVDSLDAPVFSVAGYLQRAINVLRCAAHAPRLLLVDEPTSGLDERGAELLIPWLREIGRRFRIVVSLHHQGQARKLADRVLLIGGGYLLAYAQVEEFFSLKSNEFVQQFVRTGSLSLPAPDAIVSELDSSVSPPRPLPRQAVVALASVAAAPSKISIEPERATPPPMRHPSPCPKPPEAHLAALPGPSRTGVEDASTVGLVTMTDHLGPRGFHWIVPGKLAGCPEPGITAPLEYDLDLLRATGITCLITLTEQDLDQAALKRHELFNLHLPIFDREAPTIGQAYMLLIRMQRLMDQGNALAVHCKAGLGRTGTILAAWLVREGGLSATTAIERIRMINRNFIQTQAQETFLTLLEQDITHRIQ